MPEPVTPSEDRREPQAVNVSDRLFQAVFDLTVEEARERAVIDVLRHTLTEREALVLDRRIFCRKTLKECGLEFSVTREWIRQIQAKALRKLRLGAARYRLRRLYGIMETLPLEAAVVERDTLQTRPVRELELSVRAMHVLALAKIDTIEQLLRTDPQDVLRFRGCGRKTLREIQAELAKHQLGDGTRWRALATV